MQSLLLIFIICLVLQVVFLFLFERAFSRYRLPKVHGNQPLSIIVAAKNEAEHLSTLIPDILNQDYPEFELIIIDNESTDGTPQVIWDYAMNHRVKYMDSGPVPEDYNPKKWALTKGIEAAKYDWLVFTDADVRIHSNKWLVQMSQGFGSGKEFVLAVSPYLKKLSSLNIFIRYETLLSAFQYVAFALMGRPYMGVGRNLAYRKSTFTKNGGFGGIEYIKGGDDDLFVNRNATRSNTSVILGQDSLVFSYPKTDFPSYFNQKIRHLSVGKYYKSKDKWLLGLFLLSHFGVWFTGVVLLVAGFVPLLVLIGWLTRYIFLVHGFYRAIRKMEVGFEWHYLIFLDFVYPLYYISTSIGTLWAKRIQWKKNGNSQIRHSKTSG